MTVLFNATNVNNVKEVINKQQQLKEVVEHSDERLKKKKDFVETKESNIDRMLLLNQSHSSLLKNYLIILFIFLLVCGSVLIIVFVQKYLGYSSTWLDILLTVIVGIGVISIFNTIMSIRNRDKIDFDKVEDGALLAPKDYGKKFEDENETRVLKVSQNICIGAECCGPGYEYCGNVCVIPTPAA